VIVFGLYLVATLCGAAGICGHTPVLTRLARQAYTSLTNTASRNSRTTEPPPEPLTGRTEPRPSPSWSKP